ncbi:MAG: hypothetical protein WBQ08_12380 [Candidatus Sulfotelmatobacter sp.]
MKTNPKLAPAHLALCLAAAVCLIPLHAAAQAAQTTAAETAASHTVPVIDGGIGTCSANFTVTDDNAAPVYDAKIHVHIAYGFMYLRKMDLEIGTNIDGKARFTGLPARTKDGLAFQASKADRAGTAFVDPSTACKADLTIVLQKKIQ